MVIEPSAAHHFIDGYQRLLLMVIGQFDHPSSLAGLPLMVKARKIITDDPARLHSAAEVLVQKGEAIAEDVLTAVQSMQLQQWVYLRDTTKYSVFIDPKFENAYAVLGLTQPLKTVVGGSGAMFETAVMNYRGQYVCDSLFSGQLVWLGAAYRSSFSEKFADIKKLTNFYKVPDSA